jgi:hypothetical protein
MKLTTTDIANLNKIIEVCSLVKIDALLFNASEDNEVTNGTTKLSGIDKDRTCVIITDENVIQLERGTKLALTKLKTLKPRLELFKTDPKFSIDIKKKTNGEASELLLKGSNASITHRAAPMNTVKCPSKIEDTPMKRIQMTREEVVMILNAEKAMGSKKITISVKKDNQVSVEFSDSNNDSFATALSLPAEDIGDASGASFVSFYFTDIFTPLVRTAASEVETVIIDLYEASAKIRVSGYDVIMIAPMDDQ